MVFILDSNSEQVAHYEGKHVLSQNYSNLHLMSILVFTRADSQKSFHTGASIPELPSNIGGNDPNPLQFDEYHGSME